MALRAVFEFNDGDFIFMKRLASRDKSFRADIERVMHALFDDGSVLWLLPLA